METDAGQDMKRWVKVHHWLLVRARAQGPAPSLFHPCLTQPKQYAADLMKSMMYFDPPLHILTSIHLHIWPSPYLT